MLSGTYVQVNATTWRNLKTGADVITHNSPWTLTLPDGSTVNLGEDFEWGDFDLDLLATPTAPQPTLTILGDLTPVEPLQYDELGNLVVDPNTPAPDRDDALNGRDSDTEGDLIQGLGGDDILTGKAGDDQLFSLYRDLIGSFPNLHLVPFDARIAEISSDLRARYDLPTPDAIQVATALQQGAETFVTNDTRLKRVREIRITLSRKTN